MSKDPNVLDVLSVILNALGTLTRVLLCIRRLCNQEYYKMSTMVCESLRIRFTILGVPTNMFYRKRQVQVR